MEPSLTALRAFLAVAEELHFGRAAERLYTSAPTVSQHIKRLEQQLDVPLLVRTSRHVELTTTGKEMIEVARHVVAASDEFSAWVRRVRAGQPFLRLGFWTNAAGPLTASIITATITEMPDLDLQLRHLGWGKVSQAVLDGDVDVAFCRDPIDRAGLRHTTLLTEPRVLAVHRDHPLADRNSITIGETAAETFILPREGSEVQRRYWLVDPRPDGSHPKTGPTAADLDEILVLVAAGMGVNITGAAVATGIRRTDIAFIPISDIEPVRVYLIARERSTDPLVRRFEQIAANVAERGADKSAISRPEQPGQDRDQADRMTPRR